MSQTFTLQSTTNVLSVNNHPSIELDPNALYCLGIIGYHTYNTIPNIEENCNNLFEYADGKQIKIPAGWYEITDIELFLQNQLISGTYVEKIERDKVLR